MDKYLIIIPVLLVLLAIVYLYPTGEQTVSISDFKDELNASSNVSIVMDTRNSKSPMIVMDCGVSIATAIGGMGKSPDNIVYDENSCFYSKGLGDITNLTVEQLNATRNIENLSIQECQSRISNSVVLYVAYNDTKNSTSFYKSKAVIEGDNGFLTDCVLSRLIG